MTIHGADIEITLVDGLKGKEEVELLGEADFEAKKISIRKDSASKYEILAHEMAHHGLEYSGLRELIDTNMEEAICVALEKTFGPLLKELMSG